MGDIGKKGIMKYYFKDLLYLQIFFKINIFANKKV